MAYYIDCNSRKTIRNSNLIETDLQCCVFYYIVIYSFIKEYFIFFYLFTYLFIYLYLFISLFTYIHTYIFMQWRNEGEGDGSHPRPQPKEGAQKIEIWAII